MLPTKTLFAVALGLGAGLLAVPPAAAASSTARCEATLVDLGSIQAALDQMEQALTDNAAHHQALELEIATLDEAIALRRADDAKAEVQTLVEHRKGAVAEREQTDSLTPALERQRAALAFEVETMERGYIACIESTLE